MADEAVVDAEVTSFAPLGEVFNSVRNAKNLALKDVSNNLRLSIKQIEALENNDFASLPPAMITRGFIRNYARLLEIDAEPLLASYRARIPEAMPSALSVQTSMNQVMSTNSNNPSVAKYFVIAGLIGLSLVAGYYYSNHIQKPVSHVEATTSSINQPVAAVLALPEAALPAAERLPQTDAAISEGSDVVTTSDAATVKDLPLEKSKPEATAKVKELNAVAVTNKVEQIQPLPTVNTNQLSQAETVAKEAAVDFQTLKEKTLSKQGTANVPVAKTTADTANAGLKSDSKIAAIKGVNIAVSEQTWVRVTDKTGAVVYEKMLQPNSEDGFNGLPPLKLLIGNAKATKLTFLGQPIDLSPDTKNNVAHVTLE